MLLSVIVPVYRTAATLDRTVESILRGGWEDMEVWLVDDGGKDECPAMCDTWAGRDTRITAIHKTNGGLSDARNAAIDQATGDCIAFIDSDDYISHGAFGRLMKLMEAHEDWDMLEFAVERELPQGRTESLLLGSREYAGRDAYWMETEGYRHSYAWNKIWRRRLFEQGTRFPKGRVFEDQWTTPLLLATARTIATTDCATYYYTLSQQGITAQATATDTLSLLQANIATMRQYTAHPLYARYWAQALNIALVLMRYEELEITNTPEIQAMTQLAPTWRQVYSLLTPHSSLLTITKTILAKLINTTTLCKIYRIAMPHL